eukprot:TRINITY_DN1073_c0_g1_i1.p1 TRINITY_DN1073_c0_g1~~TRINITY_DN1073_c0_g1_i1.p1  ORF type:complete len:123 (+),score=26.86 TRINITY_DN1073_c0_g1_i1:234-602(+)
MPAFLLILSNKNFSDLGTKFHREVVERVGDKEEDRRDSVVRAKLKGSKEKKRDDTTIELVQVGDGGNEICKSIKDDDYHQKENSPSHSHSHTDKDHHGIIEIKVEEDDKKQPLLDKNKITDE